MEHKNGLDRLTVRQLRARRRRLASGLSDVETLLRGTLVSQGRRCGKETCRCATGDLHGPYTYLSLPRPGVRPRMVYVPADLVDLVSAQVAAAARLEAVLAESIAAAVKGGAVQRKHFERVTIDTTVETKAVAHPSDSHLLYRGIEWLNRLAKRHGDTRLSALRAAQVTAEAVVGLLAWSCGWLAEVRPITPRELLSLFRLEAIPRAPFTLTPDLLARIGYEAKG